MDIDKLTFGEVKKIRTLLSNMGSAQQESVDHGFCIAVFDRGFVYVGDVTTDGQFVEVTNARNIRRWGTVRGLGQLALEGPQTETKLDNSGDITAPLSELNHLMKCDDLKWR